MLVKGETFIKSFCIKVNINFLFDLGLVMVRETLLLLSFFGKAIYFGGAGVENGTDSLS